MGLVGSARKVKGVENMAVKAEVKMVTCGWCKGSGLYASEQCPRCSGTGVVEETPPPPPYKKYEIGFAQVNGPSWSKFKDGTEKPSIGSFNGCRIRLKSIADCMRVIELADLDKLPNVWIITEHNSEHDTWGTRVLTHPLVARVEAESALDHAESIRESEDRVKELNNQPRVLEVKLEGAAGYSGYRVRLERDLATFEPNHSMQIRSYVRTYIVHPGTNASDSFDPDRYITKGGTPKKKDFMEDIVAWHKVDEVVAKGLFKRLSEFRDLENRFRQGHLKSEDKAYELPIGTKLLSEEKNKG